MNAVNLIIRTLHGDKKDVQALPSDSVQTLKERIAEWQHTTAENVIVTLKGRFLDEDLTLEAAGVRDGATLIATVKGKRRKPLMPRGLIPASEVQPPKPPRKLIPNPMEPPVISEVDLASLVEMGYPEEEAHSALWKANGDVDIALSLLLGENPNAVLFDKLRAEIVKDPSQLDTFLQQLIQIPEVKANEAKRPGQIIQILTRGLDVPLAPITPDAVAVLRDMGFADAKAREILAATNGNVQLALDILLST